MQQQQVSTLQIRALGALCRLLSQVWRGRIALAIPKLHEVWTKYAANLFLCRIRRGGEKKSQDYILVYLLLWMPLYHVQFRNFLLFFFFYYDYYFSFISSSEVQLNTYVLVQTVILNGLQVTSNQQLNTRHSIKRNQSNRLNQITRTKRECEHWHRNYQSWGNWQDQQQASVLHMACHFHSFHKENTKSVISHYLRLINNEICWICSMLQQRLKVAGLFGSCVSSESSEMRDGAVGAERSR